MSIPFIRATSNNYIEFLCCGRRLEADFFTGYKFCPDCGTEVQGSLVCRRSSEPRWCYERRHLRAAYEDYSDRPKANIRWEVQSRLHMHRGWTEWDREKNAYCHGNNYKGALYAIKEVIYDDDDLIWDKEYRIAMISQRADGTTSVRTHRPKWAFQRCIE